jgi:Na+-transporting NADH:ubiquinone oxidoreductase subunit NqrC
MSWFSRFMLANWPHILNAFILLMALLCGVLLGASRVQKSWDAEKLEIALTQARQVQRVADVRQTQSQITQEISNEYAKRSKLLADRQSDSRAGGVCNVTATSAGDLPAVPEATVRATSAPTDPLPSPQGDAVAVSCEQLSKDAAQTTLMLTALQRWYELQSQAFK